MEQQIDTIFVDLGDTFRVIRKDEAYQSEAKAVIARLLGVDGDPAAFYREVIEPRYDKYREWALTFYCEAPVKELWTRWLAYDFPRERVEAAADEMTCAYRKTKGERVVTDGGAETVRELYKRGYTTVQQSSVCLIRKPHPAIYYYALAECGADPKRTCYVGDNLARDIVGAKAAGLGMTIGVQYPGKKPQEVTEANRPDRFITHFAQLLDIFPAIR